MTGPGTLKKEGTDVVLTSATQIPFSLDYLGTMFYNRVIMYQTTKKLGTSKQTIYIVWSRQETRKEQFKEMSTLRSVALDTRVYNIKNGVF